MTDERAPNWLRLAREIQSLSQTGLHFSETDYHRHRYRRLLEIAAEIVSLKSTLEKEEVLDNFTGQPGYATPKVDVRGVVLQEERLLLVQERADQRWSLPGGWADVGETPSEMVEREVLEESGLQVATERLLGAYDANRGGRPLQFYHAYKLIFLCRRVGGALRPSPETLEARFFEFDDLPPLSEQRTDLRHIEDIRRLLREGGFPAFD